MSEQRDAEPKRCEPCRATGAIHCAHPAECGGPWNADPQPDKEEIMRLADEYAIHDGLAQVYGEPSDYPARAALYAAVERVVLQLAGAEAKIARLNLVIDARTERAERAEQEVARADYATRRAVERAERAEREAAENKRDAERLDWIERFIAENGEIHLHDGKHPRGTGLGLIGRRTLRAAIDAAMKEGK